METCDIIIIGAGPTGSVLSAILSRSTPRPRTITLERDTQITTDPRGIALDEDGIRLLQGVGLYKETFAEIGEGMGYFNFIPGKNDLSVPPFLRFNLATVDTISFIFFPFLFQKTRDLPLSHVSRSKEEPGTWGFCATSNPC